jgi:hypothetical protein
VQLLALAPARVGNVVLHRIVARMVVDGRSLAWPTPTYIMKGFYRSMDLTASATRLGKQKTAKDGFVSTFSGPTAGYAKQVCACSPKVPHG